MLDGKRYYKAFPDEKPTLSSLHALLRILGKTRKGIQEVCQTIGRGQCTRDRSKRAKRRISAIMNQTIHNDKPAAIWARCSRFSRPIAHGFQRLMPVSFKSSRIPSTMGDAEGPHLFFPFSNASARKAGWARHNPPSW